MPSPSQERSPAFEAGRLVGEILGLAICAAFTGLLIAVAVLAIIGSEEAAPFSATCTGLDCGTRFTDSETGEYEFATRDRMNKLLRADGWQADPVLCPACQPEGPAPCGKEPGDG